MTAEGQQAMPDLNDPARLRSAQGGDEAALAALIASFMPVICRFARAAACPGLDFEDAVQEGYIGLFYAVRSFDENGRAAFSTYAAVCIRNAIVAARRSAGRKKRQLPVAAPRREEGDLSPGPEEMAILKEQVSEAMAQIETKLSGFEKRAFLLSLRGRSYTEIAKELSRTPKAVDNALVRVRRKLKQS